MRFKNIIFAALALVVTPAFAQVKQSGTITAGHATSWTTNGIIQDAGTAGAGALNALGITASGTPLCINDAPVTGQYHQLCLGANSLGGGLLSYTANGGASNLPFQFLFNGGAVVFNGGSLALGTLNTTQGSLIIYGGTSGTVTVKTAAVAGTYNWLFPQTAGTTGQPLLSGGGGSSPNTWGNLSGNTSTFATTSGALISTHCAVFDASGNITDNGQGCGGSGTVNAGSAGQYAYYASSTNAVSGSTVLSVTGGNLTDTGSFTAVGIVSTGANTLSPANLNDVLSPTGTGFVTINPSTLGTMDNMTIGGTTSANGTFTSATSKNNLNVGVAGVSIGQILISGNTGGTITEKPQASAGTYNWNLPITAGTNGQPLISGGGGGTAMSWGTLGGTTSEFATVNGALTAGHCVNIDASGNFQDAGAACNNGSGTVNSGTSGQISYYASSTNAVSGNANANISGGALTLGVLNSTAGSLILDGSSSGAVTIKTQAAAGTFNFNIPITAGTAGQPLLSAAGGSSPMTWGTLSGNTTKFITVTGSLTNGNCIAADASGNAIDNGSPCGSGGSGTVTAGVAGQMAYYASSTAAVAGNSFANISSGQLTLGVLNTSLGSIVLDGSSSGAVTLKPQAAAGTWEWDWPTSAGSAGQVLTSQGGAGSAMTWTTAGVSWGGAPKTVNFNATANTRYCIDTFTTGAVTMTLPTTPADGTQIQFIDCKSNFATANLTVARGGSDTIMGLAASMTVNTNNAASYLVYSSTLTDWRLN